MLHECHSHATNFTQATLLHRATVYYFLVSRTRRIEDEDLPSLRSYGEAGENEDDNDFH